MAFLYDTYLVSDTYFTVLQRLVTNARYERNSINIPQSSLCKGL